MTTPIAHYWRCLTCPTTGVGDGGAERHTRSKHHPTITTTNRATFARWQKEAEAR